MQKKREFIQYLIFLADWMMLTAAYVLAYAIRFYCLPKGVVGGDYFMLYMVVVVMYALVYVTGMGKYREVTMDIRQDVYMLLRNHFYVGLFVFAFLFVMKSGVEYSRLQIFLFLFLSIWLTTGMRRMMRREIKNRFRDSDAVEHIVLAGTGAGVLELYSRMQKQDMWYCRVIGVCSIDGDVEMLQEAGLHVLATGEHDIYEVLARESLDSVMIATRQLAGASIDEMVERFSALGIVTQVQIQENASLAAIRQYDEIGDVAVMRYQGASEPFGRAFVCRGLDMLAGMLGIACCLVLWLPVAAAIKLTSRGPVLIGYTRVGKNGRRFHVYGFRTMCYAQGVCRQTGIGRVLVASGLQCLPMAGCLLRGDMTLAGLRAPSLPEFLSYTAGQRCLLSRKPGVLASWVAGRAFDEEEQGHVLAAWMRERENLFAEQPAPQEWAEETKKSCVYHFCKRIADILLSVCAICILAPVWIFLALIIFLYDGHNPVYTQVRVGRFGKKISIYKFRSMSYRTENLERILTPKQLAQYRKEFKLEDDPRVTRIGKWLRRYSLDELPQLLNILKGELSIVGPRPIVEKETQLYGDEIGKLLSIKPGLTGYWQACARNHATYETGERQKMELYYVEHESLLFDCKLLLKTVTRVISGDGAM